MTDGVIRDLRAATLVSSRLRGVRGAKIHAAAAMVRRTSWRVLNSLGIDSNERTFDFSGANREGSSPRG